MRVLPAPASRWKATLTGELEERRLSEKQQDRVLACHNPETIKQLSFRMKLMLSRPIFIGTTADAIELHKERRQMNQAIIKSLHGNVRKDPSLHSTSSTLCDAFLIVHSPDHGAGKTMLVETLASRELGCKRVHIIRPGPLLAKYGINADTALESLLHEVVVSSAIRVDPICVILDQMDALMPASFSSTSSVGDSASPALNGIASYLKLLTQRLKRHCEFPFPSKNPLYDINGRHGCALPVKVCLVAIVTCPDDGWRSNKRSNDDSYSLTILESIQAGRFRLPFLSASTRLSAFRHAFSCEGISLEKDANEALPFLAASASWAFGSVFVRIARFLKAELTARGQALATVADLRSAFSSQSDVRPGGSTVEFLSSQSGQAAPFASIGGNEEAKRAIEDALALDKNRRQLLNRLGLPLPTGLLLYGPPGTGKTLLARAVAKQLQSSDATIGGAFISLSSSDVVRAEVGTGEKMVADAFETARMNSPSVIFIDEFQALFVERSRAGSGRLTSTLLQSMEKISFDKREDATGVPGKGARVLVLAATNTPWMIDKAFLRPGRFDRAVYVGLPGLSDRSSVLEVHIRRMQTNLDDEERVALCDTLAKRTEGFSGADLAALCRSAAVRCLSECGSTVHERHFLEALEMDVKASNSEEAVKRIEHWHL